MSADSKIEWTDKTWNPTRGCQVISPGCKNCYAMKQAHRFSGKDKAYEGLTQLGKNGPVWTGLMRTVPEMLERPLRWKKPSMIFVNSMSDLFHDDVPDEYIAAVFGVMAAAPQHTFQILTKRAERLPQWFAWADAHPHGDGGPDGGPFAAMGKALSESDGIDPRFFGGEGDEGDALARALDVPWPLPNVWLGVSVEDQKYAEERIQHLLRTPAAVRFLSVEPLLGPVDLTEVVEQKMGHRTDGRAVQITSDVLRGGPFTGPHVDWVIIGGESGPGARTMELKWARAIVEQCKAARVPVFVKQLGAKCEDRDGGLFGAACLKYENGYPRKRLTHKKGGDPAEWPEDLRGVRQFPQEKR